MDPDTGTGTGAASFITIDPPFLDFRKRPLCIPAVKKVELVNTALDRDFHLYSISADNVQFHPAMFKPQVLAPQGRANIQVIFLPRTQGKVEGSLVIQTSMGGFLYQVCSQLLVVGIKFNKLGQFFSNIS